MNTKTLFSRKSDNWATPKEFYKKLDQEFNFTLDPCPLSPIFDGLKIDWSGRVFVNPPYSNQRAFFEKAIQELDKGNIELAVFLLPARTDTRFFHDLIYNKYEIRFIKGRLKFNDSCNSAPFPSMLVICK